MRFFFCIFLFYFLKFILNHQLPVAKKKLQKEEAYIYMWMKHILYFFLSCNIPEPAKANLKISLRLGRKL